MHRLVCLTGLLVVATPVAAQESRPAPKQEKKICRAEASRTGSIMPAKKVCHSRDEWAEIDRVNGWQAEVRQRRDGSAPLKPDAG